MTLQKKAGPIQVRSGSRLTGAEFYARVLEERGTLALIDNAIAAAFDALESKPTPIERAYVEKALLTIAGVFAGNPNGTEPPAPRIIEACQLLERFGANLRARAEHDRLDAIPLRRQIVKMLAICKDKGWSPRKRGIAKLIAGEMGVTEHEVRKYLRIHKKRTGGRGFGFPGWGDMVPEAGRASRGLPRPL